MNLNCTELMYSKKICHKHCNHNFSLHRALYQYYFGDIPEGYDIHHKDFNALNNDINNLKCLTKSEHAKLHRNAQMKNRKILTCAYCGKEFSIENNRQYKFCSVSCREKFRYHSGKDAQTRHCEYCGKEFTANKWNHTKFCSKSCANKFAGTRQVRTCPICGKSFEVKRSKKQICCSLSCAGKLKWINRRKTD